MAHKFRQARELFGAVNTLMRIILLEIFPISEIKKYYCSIFTVFPTCFTAKNELKVFDEG
jgi:hypothetical protein